MFMTDGLHLSGKGAAVFGNELSGTVVSGTGSITNFVGCIFVSIRSARGYLKVPHTGQEATSTYKPVTKCPGYISKTGFE